MVQKREFAEDSCRSQLRDSCVTDRKSQQDITRESGS